MVSPLENRDAVECQPPKKIINPIRGGFRSYSRATICFISQYRSLILFLNLQNSTGDHFISSTPNALDSMPPPPPLMNSPMNSMDIMRRSFYWGSGVEFYFAGWPSSGHVGMYILAIALLLGISVFNEYLSNLRGSHGGNKAWAGGLVETLCHTIRVATAYLLMLAVMSYNLGVFAAVIVGSAIGFYVFRRQHTREEEYCNTDA